MNQHVDMARRPPPLPTVDDFARAKADYADGQGVAHVVMTQWLLTWGKAGRKDFGDWLKDQDG